MPPAYLGHTYKQEGVSDAEVWQERNEARYFRTLVRNVAGKVAVALL